MKSDNYLSKTIFRSKKSFKRRKNSQNIKKYLCNISFRINRVLYLDMRLKVKSNMVIESV